MRTIKALLLYTFISVQSVYALTFDQANSPYYINVDLVVDVNDTVFFEEGSVLYLDSNVNIIIKGQAFFYGTHNNPIQFLPQNPGIGWGKLIFDNLGSIPNSYYSINNLNIVDGLIESIHAHIKVFSVEIINTQDLTYTDLLLYVRLGSASVDSSYFESTNKGEGIQSLKSDYINVTNSQFIKTPDAVELIGVKKGIISGNIFKDMYDDAIDLNNSMSIKISDNYISNVSDRGMEIGSENNGSSLNITIEKNIIEGCNEGIIFKEGSMGFVTNNTLYGNNIGLSCVELVSGSGGSLILVENTIFSKSTFQDINVDLKSSLEISYSLSDREMLLGENNLLSNPLFEDEEAKNFMLTCFSPCIDTGNPLSKKDKDCTVADLGAIYFPQQNKCEEIYFSSINVYPSIFSSYTNIEYKLDKISRVKLSVFDIGGKEVEVLAQGFQEKGYHVIKWNGTEHNGMYILRLEQEQNILYTKVIQNKK